MSEQELDSTFLALVRQIEVAETDNFIELAKILELDPLHDFAGANLCGTDLSGVNLSGANFFETDLSEANLCGADLSGANLGRANLRGANLKGANLRGANLKQTHLQHAQIDESTVIERGLQITHSVIEQPEQNQYNASQKDQTKSFSSDLDRTKLDQVEAVILYDYLLEWVSLESPNQLIERFRRLFIDVVKETDPRIQLVLDKISDSNFPIEEFNSILNRCCYTILNRWAMRPTLQQMIPEFLGLLETATPLLTQTEKQRRLNKRIKLFTQTQQFSALKELSKSMAALRLSLPVATYALDRPLNDLIPRYPFLYENYLISSHSIDVAQEITEIVRRTKIQKQRQFEMELTKFVVDQVQNPQELRSTSHAVSNPTLLPDQQLIVSLKQFAGDIEGSNTEKDLSIRFLSHAKELKSYAEFKDELYQYLTSTIDSRYGSHGFYRRLRSELTGTLPEYNSQRINETSLISTCKRLLNFLITKGRQHPDHYVFIDLLSNIGSTMTVKVILRILLICNRLIPYVGQQFFVLFNHYSSYTQGTMHWFIECLENLLVAITTNFSSKDFSLVKQL